MPPLETCVRCRSPLEEGDLRCSVCGLTTPRPTRVEATDRVAVTVLRCRGCSAVVSFDPRRQGLACSFCGEVLQAQQIFDPPERVERWLPFRVDATTARRTLASWLGRRRFFAPSDLMARSTLEHLRPLYWVGWVFDASATVSWTADSDAGAGLAAWAPHAGQGRVDFTSIAVSASRGLTDRETSALLSSYDLQTEIDTRPADDPAGTESEEFDVQRSMARSRIADTISATAPALLTASGRIPGRRFRNVHAVPLLEGLVTRRLAFPAFVLAYRYDGRLFRAVLSGQNASSILGSTPVSKLRVAAAIGLGILVVLAIVFLLAR